MKQSDFDSFLDVMQLVAEQYGKKPSDGLIHLYWQGLKDYDFPAVSEAIGKHLANTDTGQFIPKIADIIRMMQGTSLDAALSAWSKVDKALRNVGPHESVVFDDAIIHKVLHDMGGWLMLGTKTEDEWPFVAKEFENRYRGFKSRNEKIEYPAKLIGLFEAANTKDGYKPVNPILIGDKNKAMEVLNVGLKGGGLLGMARLESVLPALDKK